VEWVLHRTNSLDRVDQGVAAGCDRLELDVWAKGGAFRIGHDPSLGRLVIGPNGIGLPGRRSVFPWPVRVVRRFLTVSELLEARPSAPPLLLDLKGRWPAPALASLRGLLGGRTGDALCGTFHQTLRRYRALVPDALIVYSMGQLQRDPELAASDGGPAGVSIRGDVALRRPEVVGSWRASGLRVYVWDVPVRSSLETIVRCGVDGAIVSDVSWIRTRLQW
jgi:hypothetical protein